MENEGFDVREAITPADGLVDAGTARPDLVVAISRYRMATASSLSMSFGHGQIPVLVLSP